MKINILEGFDNIEVTIKCPQITNEINKLEALLQSVDQKLCCVKDGTTHLLDAKDVLYFESVDKQSFAYTQADVYAFALRLYEIEEILAAAGFVRSAKSQIINLHKVTALRPDFGGRLEVTIAGNEKLIISRQYAKFIKERLGIR